MTNPTEPTTSKLDQLAHKRLSDVPADLLANRLTSSLIMQKGDLGKYDAVLKAFIEKLRAEFAEDFQSAEASLAEMQADHAENFGGKVVMSIEAFKELQADAGGGRLRAALEGIAQEIRTEVPVTAHYLRDNGISPHFAEVLLSHYLDFADRASLALSGGTEKQGLTASNASRAVQGTDSLAAPEAEPSAAWRADVARGVRLIAKHASGTASLQGELLSFEDLLNIAAREIAPEGASDGPCKSEGGAS